MNAKERPIIFSTEMVRALLDGRKTQSRRLIKGDDIDRIGWQPETAKNSIDLCRYGKVGDRLWVREKMIQKNPNCKLPKTKPEGWDDAAKDGNANLTWWGWYYAANFDDDAFKNCGAKFISPIHMPRWCSRIELTLTEVLIDRLNDISEADAIAEGLIVTELGTSKFYKFDENGNDYMDAVAAYYWLWNSINTKAGTRSCDNPWVWVLKFDVDMLQD